MKRLSYQGREILPAAGRGYYVYRSGKAQPEERCPHFGTVKEARAFIDRLVAAGDAIRQLSSIGGSTRTPRRAAASAKNGRRGGRLRLLKCFSCGITRSMRCERDRRQEPYWECPTCLTKIREKDLKRCSARSVSRAKKKIAPAR